MAIRLRLAMHGRRHQKVFHLVAIDGKLRRDAKPAELLGVYDPHTMEDDARVIRWSVDRIRYWLNVGATPSKSALKILELASILFSSVHAYNIDSYEQGGILKPGSPYHTKANRPLYPPAHSLPSETTP